MSSDDKINAVIDVILARMTTNLSALGLVRVTEKDEDPGYLDPNEAYVIPFAEGKDQIKLYADGEEHTYPVTIAAFYKYADIATGLRPVRNYAMDCLDLFARTNATLRGSYGGATVGAEIEGMNLEVGYWRVGDYIMHYFALRLTVKQVI